MHIDVHVTLGLDTTLLQLLANFMAGGNLDQAQKILKEKTDQVNAALAAAKQSAS